MNKRTCLILLIIGIFIIPTAYGALNTNLKAPNEFEKSSNWDTAVYDIYTLKNDNNTQLYICNYTDEDYNLFFKEDTGYHVSKLSDNMIMGKDTDFDDGYVLEIIEADVNKYIVYILLLDNPTDNEIKDTVKYLTEFNKLNKVEAIIS